MFNKPPFTRFQFQTPVCLGVILVTALLLRLIEVGQPLVDSFSWRQASTAMMATNFYRGHWNIFLPQVDWTGPEAGYQGREFQTMSYTVALLWKIFGPHDVIGRLVCIAAGTWGVFAFFQLVRRIWDDRRALGAAAILAILPGAVFTDRSFLPDPVMLSLTLTGLWLLLAWLQTAPSRAGSLVVAVAVYVLGLLTKLPSAVTLIPLAWAVHVCVAARGGWTGRAWKMALATTIVGAIPVALYYSWTVYVGKTFPPFHIAGSSNWVWKDGVVAWLSNGYFVPVALDHLSRWAWGWPVILLAVTGLLRPPPSAPPSPPRLRWFFHWWTLGCVVLWLIGAKEIVKNVWNFHIFSVPAAAFAGAGLVQLANLRLPLGWMAAVRALVLLAILWAAPWDAMKSLYEPHAAQGRALGLALRDLSESDDLVVTMANDVGDPIPIYYSGRKGWVFPPAGLPDHSNWSLLISDASRNLEVLEDLREQGADWLGIVADPRDDRPTRNEFWRHHDSFVREIHARYPMIMKTDDFVIYRLERLPAGD